VKTTAHQPDTTTGRPDIRAVARAAKVSVSTVSRAVNDKATVNPKMAERVWKAVRELNYLPNPQARALVSGRSRILGLIVSEITDPMIPELIQQFEEVALRYRYEILTACISNDNEHIARCMRRMAAWNVDAIAIMTFGNEGLLVHRILQHGVPTVFVDTAPEHGNSSVLRIDYEQGARQAIEHLAALGHRDIALMAGPARPPSVGFRLAAFGKAAQECAIPIAESRIITCDPTMQGGIAGAQQLLSSNDLPTAILCTSDACAIGALQRLSHAAIRVPQDISIVGFDDIHMAQMTFPSLTSIQISRGEMARTAVCALRRHLEHRSPVREYKLHTQLIVRQSTSVPRSG
jgi:LacI family transcriptional regulator